MDKEDIEALVQCVHLLRQIDRAACVDKKIFQGYDHILRDARRALARNPNLVPEWYSNKYWLGEIHEE